MRRIFFLITELDIGGAEKALCELACRLDRARYTVAVASLTRPGPIGDRLREAGLEVMSIGYRGWWDVRGMLRLRRQLRIRRPHALHCFLFHANLVGRLAAAGLGIPCVISSVRVEEPRWWHLWADRLTRGLADVVTCVSESVARYTRERAKIPEGKIVIIPNGIDMSHWDHPAAEPAPEWRLPAYAPVVAIIGRLDEQKDPVTMLHAAAVVARTAPDVIFAFAGEGPFAEECRDLARTLDIERNVRWLGFVQDVRPLLARAALLALSSRWEGMPNVVLEAMAASKPVVATWTGGSAELIRDGETGLLVEAGDAVALADRIGTILNEPSLAKRLGEAGRRHVAMTHEIESTVLRTAAIYDAIQL